MRRLRGLAQRLRARRKTDAPLPGKRIVAYIINLAKKTITAITLRPS